VPAGPIPIAGLTLAAAIAGWAACAWIQGAGPVAITGELTGRVSVISESGAKVCITPVSGGADRCAGLYRGPTEKPIRPGDSLEVAIAELRTGPGETTEIFILEP
jgi:hypothetical protein